MSTAPILKTTDASDIVVVTRRPSVERPSRQRRISRIEAPSFGLLGGLSAPDKKRKHSRALSRDTDMTHSDTSYIQTGNRRIEYEPTYQMEPNRKIRSHEVEEVAQSVLNAYLKNLDYDAETSRRLSQQLAGVIMEKVKALGFKRYKVVAVVSIGSIKEKPGMNFGSRCLWDPKLDTFVTVQFTNGSLFAVAMIYGLYYE
ncbi:dynein light chain Tctex-type 5-B-like [Glandiceps talaboti]